MRRIIDLAVELPNVRIALVTRVALAQPLAQPLAQRAEPRKQVRAAQRVGALGARAREVQAQRERRRDLRAAATLSRRFFAFETVALTVALVALVARSRGGSIIFLALARVRARGGVRLGGVQERTQRRRRGAFVARVQKLGKRERVEGRRGVVEFLDAVGFLRRRVSASSVSASSSPRRHERGEERRAARRLGQRGGRDEAVAHLAQRAERERAVLAAGGRRRRRAEHGHERPQALAQLGTLREPRGGGGGVPVRVGLLRPRRRRRGDAPRANRRDGRRQERPRERRARGGSRGDGNGSVAAARQRARGGARYGARQRKPKAEPSAPPPKAPPPKAPPPKAPPPPRRRPRRAPAARRRRRARQRAARSDRRPPPRKRPARRQTPPARRAPPPRARTRATR